MHYQLLHGTGRNLFSEAPSSKQPQHIPQLLEDIFHPQMSEKNMHKRQVSYKSCY